MDSFYITKKKKKIEINVPYKYVIYITIYLQNAIVVNLSEYLHHSNPEIQSNINYIFIELRHISEEVIMLYQL